MINRKYILLLTAAVLLPLAGCLKDLGPEDGGSITVEASIGAQTKVTHEGDVSTFAEGDRIAVYAWTGSASAVPDTRVVNGVVNTLGSSGWTPASEMRWKNLTDAHYFLGVNPVHTISSFTAGEYVLGTDSFAANDLLVATVLGEGRKASGGAVPLGFKHVMARLSVNVKLGNEYATSDASGVTVLAKKLATVNYLSQTASAPGSAEASELSLFAESAAPSGYALSYSAPQVPQEGVRQITVSVAGVDYVYTSGSDIPLDPGKHTTVNLVVGNDRVELSGMSVSDWVASGTLDGGEAKVVSPFFANNWLTFTSEGTTKLSLLNVAGNAPKLYYSTDTYDWTEWDYSELTFSSGAPLYICGDNPGGFSSSVSKYSKFVVSGNTCSISGDIMSLLAYDKDIKEIPCEYCFCHLFDVCKLLTKAPDLPATTLAPGCYFEMFHGCNRLETAPVLPATRLFDWSYAYMFQGCSNLNYVKCLAEDIDYSKCTYYWLDAVKSSGTFVKASGMNKWTPDSEHGIPSGWTVENVVTASKYLTFTSEGTTTISLKNYNVNAPKLYYSTDKTNWTQWDYSALTFTSSAPLYLCGDNPDGFSSNNNKSSNFADDGSKYSVSGDVMSLLNKDVAIEVIPNEFCFYTLFMGCTGLTAAPKLPAMTLAKHCYSNMFNGCTSLTTAPELKAMKMVDYCYESMFRGCTGLTAAPELKATTMAEWCYYCMFYGCTKLNYVKCLATGILHSSVSNWLDGVAASGTFIKAEGMSGWPSGASGIPEGWTVPEGVDMGNGVKWATRNVGAAKPEEYGHYFAWGETTTKSYYSPSTYFDTDDGGNTFKKYATDKTKSLEPTDDAARHYWDGKWRIPTNEEWTWLIENCTWVWQDNYNGTGVKGMLVTSKKNGNAIFLPAAGYWSEGQVESTGSLGCYWSSDIGYSSSWARICNFDTKPVNGNAGRYYGHTIRAVTD